MSHLLIPLRRKASLAHKGRAELHDSLYAIAKLWGFIILHQFNICLTKINLKGQCLVVYTQNNLETWKLLQSGEGIHSEFLILFLELEEKTSHFVEKFGAAALILGPHPGTSTDDEDDCG